MPPSSRLMPPRSGTWRSYSIDDGLAGAFVEDFAEDADGALWIATADHGVSRFDGDEFRNWTRAEGLCGDQVMCVHVDGTGRLWLGTIDGGLCRLAGDGFERPAGGPPTDAAIGFLFTDSSGRLWLSGPGTIGYLPAEGGYVDLLPRYAVDIGKTVYTCWGLAETADGSLWMAGDRLVSFDGDRFVDHTDPAALGLIFSCAGDGDGGLWVAADDRVWHDGGDGLEPLGTTGHTIRKIVADRDGRVWLCGLKGVSLLNGERILPFIGAERLGFDYCNGMCRDRDGSYWFGTWGAGVLRYDTHAVVVRGFSATPPKGSSQAQAIAEDADGRIWVLTMGQAGRADDDTWRPRPAPDATHLCATPDGAVYAAGRSRERLLRVDVDPPVPVPGFADRAGYATAMTAAADGTLYVGWFVPEAVAVLRVAAGRVDTWFHEPAEAGVVHALHPAGDGGLWLALGRRQGLPDGGGLVRLGPDGAVSARATIADGLPAADVNDIAVDGDGHLWAATAAGVCRFTDGILRRPVHVSAVQGERVRCVYPAIDGRLWLGLEGGGVRLFDGRIAQRIRSSALATVTAILRDRDGHMWFFANGGIVRYRSGTVPPLVRVVRVVADRIYRGSAIRFPAHPGQTAIEFRGLSFRTRARDMLYSWRLVGRDPDWTAPTAARSAEYDDLTPGSYRFEVKAVDQDLNVSEEAGVEIHVNTDPRAERIGDLERQVRQRTVQLQRLLRHEERSAVILRGWAHALKPRLARLREGLRDAPDSALSDEVDAVRANVDRLLETMVDLEPARFDLGPELDLLLHETARDYPGVDTAGSGASAVVVADHAKLLMAFENLLHNACQAAGDGTVSLRLQAAVDASVRVEVVDNGPGIPEPTRRRLGRGTLSTRTGGSGLGVLVAIHVIEAHGGALRFESTPGSGTTVVVDLPVTPMQSPGPHELE